MLELQGVSKVYGSRKVLDNINFTLGDNEILGFLGPNGAGKTTTMNIITGYISSTSGAVILNGHEILEDPVSCKKQIGYLPERPPLYPEMTVESFLSFVYELKKISLQKKDHINEICELAGIKDVQRRIIKNLSKGYQQRVGIAQAMLGNPALLILDEPTAGLDPKQIQEVRELIKNIKKRCSVIFSSHILQEIQSVCERIIIINGGALIANDTPQRLSALAGDNSLILCASCGDSQDDGHKMLTFLKKLPGIKSAVFSSSPQEGEYEFTLDSAKDIRRDLFRLLCEKGWPVLSLRKNDLSLEDAFLRLTAGDSSKIISLIKKGAA
ncbi:MAG: ABC transporter ATP-binding protein [Treponema sp.]|nr:ABC transporter ATP-binding protein [Treponema sp.]